MKNKMTLSEQIVNLEMVQESMDAARARQSVAPKNGTMALQPADGVAVEKADAEPNAEARKKITDLKDAPAELRLLVVALSRTNNLLEVADKLKSHGVKTSASSVCRYLRKWKALGLVEEGEDINDAAEKLAEMGKGSAVREGSLQAVRQKIFQRAMDYRKPEEGMKMFEALSGEDARLRRLALEERKVRAQERVVAVQERQLELKAASAGGGGLFLEALKILRNEQLRLEERVEMVGGMLERMSRGEVIEAGGGKLQLGEGKG